MASNPSRSIRLCTMLACSSFLGQDLLLEIFKRLPTKTLSRFLCVCKSWETLISSTLFIQLHNSFTSSSSKPPNLKPYLQVHPNSFTLCRPRKHLVKPRIRKLHCPFRTDLDPRHDTFPFVDLIHGIVCLSYSFDSSFDTTILWNPSTHKYVALPRLPFTIDLETPTSKFIAAHEYVDMADYVDMEGYLDGEAYIHEYENGGDVDEFVAEAEFKSSVIGFGYDGSTNGFKVVRIWIPNQEIEDYCKSVQPTYEVYSSRVGIWKVGSSEILKSCSFYDEDRASDTGCFVNGSIHWIVHAESEGRGERSVLMFDCESEEFRVVELPGATLSSKRTGIMEYAGMLALVVKRCHEVWVMEEHGIATTWKKLYKFNYSTFFELKSYDVCDDSFLDLAPYGPNQWTEVRGGREWYEKIMSGHVYEESLFLMDDPEAESYTEGELVSVDPYYS